ncbi:MAG: hypothetical protein HYS16_01340 [Deltaproteobacteria bacterium]|nr:MAG: hypothetical protein HYS16_01340 [Deltaproteobacteria bacterium]
MILLMSFLFYTQIKKRHQINYLSISSPEKKTPNFKINDYYFFDILRLHQKYVFLHFSKFETLEEKKTFSDLLRSLNSKILIFVIDQSISNITNLNKFSNIIWIFDHSHEISKSYHIKTHPETFLISPNGNILAIYLKNQPWSSIINILS